MNTRRALLHVSESLVPGNVVMITRAVFMLVLSAMIFACGDDKGTNSESVTLQPNVRLLSQGEQDALLYISSGQDTLRFSESAPGVSTLSQGDVVVGAAGEGFLRRIISIQDIGNQRRFVTEQASLDDVFEEADFTVEMPLRYEDLDSLEGDEQGMVLRKGSGIQGEFFLNLPEVPVYDRDGNLLTTNDQVSVSGSVSFTPSIRFSVKLKKIVRLERVEFTVRNEMSSSLVLHATASGELFDFEKQVVRLRMRSFPVQVGPVTVILTPVIPIVVGFNGEISAEVSTGITVDVDTELGVVYGNGDWEPIAEFDSEWEFLEPEISLSASAEAFVRVDAMMKVYGTLAGLVKPRGFLELNVNPLDDPWWELHGGFDARLGIQAEVFSVELFDYESPVLVGYRHLLAESQEPPPNNGSVAGMVRDATSGAALPSVKVEVLAASQVVASGQTGSQGDFMLMVPEGAYSTRFSKTGYVTETYANINVEFERTTFLEPVLQVDVSRSGPGTVTGRVISALDATGVPSATVRLRRGINVTTGNTVATVTTSADGHYQVVNLAAGNYTAEASKTSWGTGYSTVLCIGQQTTTAREISLTPVLPSGVTRIVLTWGTSPADLDSHLDGPLPDGSRFHLYFPHAEVNNGSPWPQFVTLDRDDTYQEGPETTTILQQIAGTYWFAVHDWSNQYSSSSLALSRSGARVQVFRGSQQIADFHVPTNQGGTLWTVFELTGSSITPINSMEYNPPVQGLLVSDKPVIPSESNALKHLTR